MSKAMSANLLAHYQGSTSTIAACWKVTRSDTTVFAFTTHIDNLIISGTTYLSASAFAPTEIIQRNDGSVDNLEVLGILNSSTITEADLFSGRWDNAEIEYFEVNYKVLGDGVLKERKGNLGPISITRPNFRTELRGANQRIQTPVGDVYQPTCRVELGDAKCQVNLTSHTFTGSVTSVSSQVQFTDSSKTQATEFFDRGKVTFTSGANNGLSMEIDSFTIGGIFLLALPMPFIIAVGNNYTVVRGCRKRLIEDCKTVYNNVVNFRGHPHQPGASKALQIARRG